MSPAERADVQLEGILLLVGCAARLGPTVRGVVDRLIGHVRAAYPEIDAAWGRAFPQEAHA